MCANALAKYMYPSHFPSSDFWPWLGNRPRRRKDFKLKTWRVLFRGCVAHRWTTLPLSAHLSKKCGWFDINIHLAGLFVRDVHSESLSSCQSLVFGKIYAKNYLYLDYKSSNLYLAPPHRKKKKMGLGVHLDLCSKVRNNQETSEWYIFAI